MYKFVLYISNKDKENSGYLCHCKKITGKDGKKYNLPVITQDKTGARCYLDLKNATKDAEHVQKRLREPIINEVTGEEKVGIVSEVQVLRKDTDEIIYTATKK